MKCSINVHEIFQEVSGFPRYISCDIAENGLPLGQCIGQYCASTVTSLSTLRLLIQSLDILVYTVCSTSLVKI